MCEKGNGNKSVRAKELRGVGGEGGLDPGTKPTNVRLPGLYGDNLTNRQVRSVHMRTYDRAYN